MPTFDCSEKIDIGGSRYIVLIDVAGQKDIPVDESCKNIYCIDGDQKIVWQVDAPEPKFERDPFVSLSKDGEVIKASRFFGA